MDANEAKFLGALLVAVCVVTVILVFFIITITRYHRQNLRLYREKLALEIETLERERARIATDLHDHLGPILSAVKLQASVLNPTDEQDRCIIIKLKQHVDSIVESIRMIANDLRPNTLERKGLTGALRAYIGEINHVHSMKVSLETTAERVVLTKEQELHVFRMIQEIIHNSLKHSGASCCTVRMQHMKTGLRIRIVDDGSGFDFENKLRESSGCGLKNLVNRVELLKGALKAAIKTGGGTVYIIDIPLKNYEQRKDQSSDCRRPGDIQRWAAIGS